MYTNEATSHLNHLGNVSNLLKKSQKELEAESVTMLGIMHEQTHLVIELSGHFQLMHI